MTSRACLAACTLALLACGDDGGGAPIDAAVDAEIVNGCPTWRQPLAQPGDPIDGDTYTTFAMPLFQAYCVRCHATALTGGDRNGAPPGYNWDDEASVRLHQAEMRNAIGVANFMPPSDPRPSCDDRRRLVRWIDADNPH